MWFSCGILNDLIQYVHLCKNIILQVLHQGVTLAELYFILFYFFTQNKNLCKWHFYKPLFAYQFHKL